MPHGIRGTLCIEIEKLFKVIGAGGRKRTYLIYIEIWYGKQRITITILNVLFTAMQRNISQ